MTTPAYRSILGTGSKVGDRYADRIAEIVRATDVQTAKRFALLTLDSSNRVYNRAAVDLLAAELLAVAGALHAELVDVNLQTLGGVDYVVFTAHRLDGHDRFIVSNLSSVRALFELHGDGLLAPLELEPLAYFTSDLVTIQRYPGKTNEQFTHLLSNLAVAASSAAAERAAAQLPVRVLDPVAGRGTTLNRALTYGYNVAGIEISAADFDQYRTFLATYLKNNRIKHRISGEKVRKGPLAGSERLIVRIGGGQRLELVHGDTEQAAEMFPARSFDVVVGDLPYGVQHRASAGGGKARSPFDLLAASLTGWRTVMRGGAALGLAWNTKTLPRVEVERLLSEHGFDIVEQPASFEHVVDRSILRDLIVARNGGARTP